MENPSKARQIKAKDWFKWMVPAALTVLVSLMSFFPRWIETVYSAKIYPYIAQFQRALTGWLPFSLGDILYTWLAIWLFIKIFKTVRAAIRKKITKRKTGQRALRLLRFFMWTYIVFNLVWGWNYHRKGLEYQLQLPIGKYHSSEVKQVLAEVVQRLNENRLLISSDTTLPERTFSEFRAEAKRCYDTVARQFHFLSYSNVSVKKSIYSAAAQYFGFTGYYNPFSGEAQLRTQIPEVMKPFIVCHEIGHQLGYAKEDEASFAGYLASAASRDPYFRYSVYLDLYISVRRTLKGVALLEKDTTVNRVIAEYHRQLDTLVRYDQRKMREYFRKSQSYFSEEMSSVVLGMYEQYLRANAQAAGLKSYDDVISLLIAYRRKYGKI